MQVGGSMKSIRSRIVMNVVEFFDETQKEWCAVALEMSLFGFATTPEKARGDLSNAVIFQIIYALEHYGTIDHILIPASEEYWNMYEDLKKQAIVDAFTKKHRTRSKAAKQSSKAVPPETYDNVLPYVSHARSGYIDLTNRKELCGVNA